MPRLPPQPPRRLAPLQQPQEQCRRPDVGQDCALHGHLLTARKPHADGPAPAHQHALDAAAETDFPTGLAQPHEQRVGDRTGAAGGNAKAAAGREQGEHQAEAGTGAIIRAEIDVQRQAGNDSPGGLGAEATARKGCGRGQAGAGQPEEVERTEAHCGTEARQRRQQGGRQSVPHLASPGREATPGRAVGAERGDGPVDVAAEDDAAAVGRRMTALPQRVAPHQAGAHEVEGAEGGAVVGEGEKGGADVVDEAGPGERLGPDGAPGPVLGFQDKDLPAGAGQHRRRRQPVRPRPDHDGVHRVDYLRYPEGV